MEDIFKPDTFGHLWLDAVTWLDTRVLSLAGAIEVAAVIVAFGIARLLAPLIWRRIERVGGDAALGARLQDQLDRLRGLSLGIVWVALLWLASIALRRAGTADDLTVAAASLVSAWVAIRFTSGFIRDPALSRLVALMAWTFAALNILGLLEATLTVLDALAVNVGELRISVLSLLEALVLLAVLLWLAGVLSRLFERRIQATANLTPSVQVLFAKLLRVLLITIAIVAALSSVGIDLTAFAVFSGAVGVGLGFGLQKVVSNLVSGIILLLDRSVKPGDVIAVADTIGWINSLGARYVSVITRDGIEHLIPNEDLITQRVENWSYSNENVRLKIDIGISYKSDVRKAMALCLEAATSAQRVLATPGPICLLSGFGDSSVDLSLRFWIKDPPNGISNVKSEVLLGVWDRFHANGIEIPFPQRDLHLKTPVAMVEAGAS